ncbi:hypothetical protein H8356DRAFT_1086941 [Neocallimastix lanati (nom. inval.)]|nr:hypothetical protein H8356DRAFT_1086941 [Neocallimastix sp. JGI-2020a]
MSTMEINNSQLKNQLQKLQSYNIILEKDKNTLIEDKSAMERNICINHAKFKEKEKQINNKITELIEENKKINNLLEENSNCIEEYKLAIQQKENQLNASLKENDLLKSHIEELTKDNYKVLDDIRALKKTIKHKKNEINLLNKEISKYKKLDDDDHQAELSKIKRFQEEKNNENIQIIENFEKEKKTLMDEISKLKIKLKENEDLYKKKFEQCEKEWEYKYQNSIQSKKDDSEKLKQLIEENKNYAEKCNSLQKKINKYISEEISNKKNQQLGIEIQKNIEKDLSEIDNLSKIDIELPKQLSNDDNEINSIIYEKEPKEISNNEDYKLYYDNRKKEDIFAENQTLRQKIIELQDQIIQELKDELQKKQEVIEDLIKSHQNLNINKKGNEIFNEYNDDKNDYSSFMRNYDKVLYENKLLKEKLRDAITDLEYMNLERNKLVEISNELKAELKQYEENEKNLKDTQTQTNFYINKNKIKQSINKENINYNPLNKTITKKIPPKQSQRITIEQQQAQNKLKANQIPIYQSNFKKENRNETFQQYLKSKGVRNWNQKDD